MISQDVGQRNRLYDRAPPLPYHGIAARPDNQSMAETKTLDVSQRKLEGLIRDRAQTQEQRAELIKRLAAHCGCGRELIYMWLNGTRRITDGKLRRAAEFFNVSESYLKYGKPPLDTDTIDNVVHVVISALIESGVIQTSVSADQISSLVSRVCADYENRGRAIDYEAIYSYIRIMAPAAAASTQTRQ